MYKVVQITKWISRVFIGLPMIYEITSVVFVGYDMIIAMIAPLWLSVILYHFIFHLVSFHFAFYLLYPFVLVEYC